MEKLRKLSLSLRKDSSVQEEPPCQGIVAMWAARTARSMSLVSYGHETNFKCKLTITKKNGGDPVYFKRDGARFETASETLKLQVDTAYLFVIDMQPSMEIM